MGKRQAQKRPSPKVPGTDGAPMATPMATPMGTFFATLSLFSGLFIGISFLHLHHKSYTISSHKINVTHDYMHYTLSVITTFSIFNSVGAY
jgi:hypothetical protein